MWKAQSLLALCVNTSEEAYLSLELPMCIQPAGRFPGQEGGGSALRTNAFAKETTSTTFCSPTQSFIHEDSTPNHQILEKDKIKYSRERNGQLTPVNRELLEEKKKINSNGKQLSRSRYQRQQRRENKETKQKNIL